MGMKHLPFLESYKNMKVQIQCLVVVLAVTFDNSLIYKYIYLVLVYSRHLRHKDISALTGVKQ